MKNLLLSLFLISFITGTSWSQNINEPKYIEVTGSAEMEITPDEIYFTIILQEYLNKEKVKVDIESLEKELQSSVNAAGIYKDHLQVENVYGQQWANRKKKPTDFFAKKVYVIKLIEISKIDAIINKIDGEGINNVYISNYSHSNIQKFKKDLQIKAIQNAKEKATYLLAAINEQLGGAKHISENLNSEPVVSRINPSYVSNSSSRFSGLQYNSENSFSVDEISFNTIKLRFEISAEFFIK